MVNGSFFDFISKTHLAKLSEGAGRGERETERIATFPLLHRILEKGKGGRDDIFLPGEKASDPAKEERKKTPLDGQNTFPPYYRQ